MRLNTISMSSQAVRLDAWFNKAGTAFCVAAVVIAVGLVAVKQSLVQLSESSKKHKVTLTWIPSASKVTGYNVYRSTRSGGPYEKVNKSLVRESKYVDESVASGKTYYYVVRSADEQGRESPNSKEILIVVP